MTPEELRERKVEDIARECKMGAYIGTSFILDRRVVEFGKKVAVAFAESILSGEADSTTGEWPSGIEVHNRFCGEGGELCQACKLKAGAAPPAASPHAQAQAIVDAITADMMAESLEVRATSGGQPAPMLLACPNCNKRHHDSGEWETRPHKTHLCVDDIFGNGCGHEFRPYDFPTVGVIDIEAHRSYMILGTLTEDYNSLMVKYEALREASGGQPAQQFRADFCPNCNADIDGEKDHQCPAAFLSWSQKAFEVLAALDFSAQWEIEPSIKAEIAQLVKDFKNEASGSGTPATPSAPDADERLRIISEEKEEFRQDCIALSAQLKAALKEIEREREACAKLADGDKCGRTAEAIRSRASQPGPAQSTGGKTK